MSGFFSFLTNVRQPVNSEKLKKQEELHDALKENQLVEKKQMEMVSHDQEQQKATENALEASVRFPQEEEFQLKMKNAELYVYFLKEREATKKKDKENLMKSVRETIEWQRQKWRNPSRNRQEAAARLYLRMHSPFRSR